MSERAKVNHSEQYKRTNRTKLATHIYSVRIIINNMYIIYYYSKGKYMYVDKLLFVRMFVLVGMFYFRYSVYLTFVFLLHDSAKLKPAWFCSRCSVVSGYSVIKNLAPITIYDTFRYAASDLS